MGNRAGVHYGLTVLSPIIDDPLRVPPHDTELRAVLDSLPERPGDSPFARVPSTHFARLTIIDDVVFEGEPAHEDHLKSKYLLFTSNFDGELDPYLDSMLEGMPEEIESVWKHCYGFPGVGNRRAFRRYIRQCQLRTSFLFSDVPDATIGQVLQALRYQKSFGEFVVEHQGGDPATLKQDFEELMVRLRRTPEADPGNQ